MPDLTGVPAIVDLAAMRDAMVALGGDPKKINPLQPAELVIDHSVQVDEYGSSRAFLRNAGLELERNRCFDGASRRSPTSRPCRPTPASCISIVARPAQPMLIPEVIGFQLRGRLSEGATATDLVLTVTEMLRRRGVVGKFVEFCGSGLSGLPLPDRATIGNMAPKYGATAGYFPVDAETLNYALH
jgi:aconitate hydratase